MLSFRRLNAEKVRSSESIYVSKRTNGRLVLVEGWGEGKGCVCVCVCWGGGGGKGCA